MVKGFPPTNKGCMLNSLLNLSFLTKEEFLSLTEGVKINESISMINSIINNWAIEKILIERAELNLNETKLQKIQSLADDYKSNLPVSYTHLTLPTKA